MRDIGLTKTAAHNMKQRGYPFAYIADIQRARPTLPPGVQFVATPIDVEGKMLYSFKVASEGADFAAGFSEAQPLEF
jgi:hypothetical protein